VVSQSARFLVPLLVLTNLKAAPLRAARGACMSAVGVTAGVPVAAFATVVEGKGMNGNAAESGTDDEALQQRLAENDKVLRALAWGDIDAPPDATLVEASEPLPNRKGFDPYKPAAAPPWEQPGQSAGGCILM